MMKRVGVVVAVVTVFGMALVEWAAFAETVVFQQGLPNQFASAGYAGVRDTSALYSYYYYEDLAGNSHSAQFREQNYGASPVVYVGFSDGLGPVPGFVPPPGMSVFYAGGRGVGLIRFDVAALAGRTIESARLRISLLSFSAGQQPSVGGWLPVPPEDADWVAGTSDNVVEPGASCWSQKRYGEQNWASELMMPMGPMGPDPAGWFLSTPTGRSWPAYDPIAEATYTEVSFDLDPAMISFWAAHPQQNGGLRFVAWNNLVLSGYLVAVPSSQFQDAQLRPALEVTYVPEPSTLALVMGAGGALALANRRRRAR